MTTYPIVLKARSQSQGVSHSFTIQEGSTEGDGFEHISIWLKSQDQWSTSATYTCQVCGAILDIPDGSLRAHLKKYKKSMQVKMLSYEPPILIRDLVHILISYGL